jgi:signal transduction histidine kinase
MPTRALPGAAPALTSIPEQTIDAEMGAAVRHLIKAVGDTPAARRGYEATAELLVREASILVPGVECYLAVIPIGRADRWRVIAGAGPWAQHMVGREWPRSGTLFERAVRGRRPVESNDLAGDTVLSEVYLRAGIQVGRLVPLVENRPLPGGRIALGVLSFWRRGPEPFSRHDRALMDLYGHFAGMTISGVEDRQTAERTASRLRTGIDVAIELGSTLDANVIIMSLLKRAAAALDADRAALLALDDSSLMVQGSFDIKGGRDETGTRFKITPALKRVLDTHAPALAPYEPRTLHTGAVEKADGMRQSVSVPLVLLGKTEGILTASRRRDEQFSTVDAETLQQIGGIALLALRNASLYGEAQHARELDREHAARMVGLEEQKSQFLNLASHELRGPLAILRGYISMLSDGTLPVTELERWLPLLQSKIDQMGMLINEMLETARLDDDRLDLTLDEVDLREILDEAIITMSPAVPPIHQVRRRAPATAVTVLADASRIQTVITNMLDNAVKYSPRGGTILVSISASDDKARLTVSDRGLGIAKEDFPRLFVRFGRLVTKDNSHISGTGLGLYLARQLARLHGGDITVRSRLQEGSAFTLTLPRVRGD